MTTTVSKVQIEKPTQEELKALGVQSWPIWSKEPSRFDWHYDDKETCYFLEGEVMIETSHETVNIGKGDLVIFPKGLSCTWHVKKVVRKHYNFG